MQSYTVKHTLKGKGCPTSRVSNISWCPFQTQSDCCCSHRAAIQRTHKPQSGCWLKTQAAYSSQIQVNSGTLKSLHPTPGSDISCYIIKHAAVKMLKKKWLQRDTGAQPANTTWESTFKHITHIYTYLKNFFFFKNSLSLTYRARNHEQEDYERLHLWLLWLEAGKWRVRSLTCTENRVGFTVTL